MSAYANPVCGGGAGYLKKCTGPIECEAVLFHGYSDKRNPRECEDCYCCGDAGSYTELLTGSGGAVWWDYIEGSEYNLSDILLQTASTRADAELPLANAKVSATVEQTICAYGASMILPT